VPAECTHCGARLPPVKDAICPECFNDLDEAPVTGALRSPAKTKKSVVSEVFFAWHLLHGLIVIAVILVITVSELVRGNLTLVRLIVEVILALAVGEWIVRAWGRKKRSVQVSDSDY
jgi:hypothetical protein